MSRGIVKAYYDRRGIIMKNSYSFCEGVYSYHWHIRKLTSVGKKLGGGVDTGSLCGYVKSPLGWDLGVEIDDHHLSHACPKCVELYKEEKNEGD